MEVESSSGARPGGRRRVAGASVLARPREGLELSSPYEGPLLSDWDGVEALLDQTFARELRADVREHPVLLAEPSQNSKEARERVVELLFERFDAPAAFLGKNAALSAFSTGRQTALIVSADHAYSTGAKGVKGEKAGGKGEGSAGKGKGMRVGGGGWGRRRGGPSVLVLLNFDGRESGSVSPFVSAFPLARGSWIRAVLWTHSTPPSERASARHNAPSTHAVPIRTSTNTLPCLLPTRISAHITTHISAHQSAHLRARSCFASRLSPPLSSPSLPTHLPLFCSLSVVFSVGSHGF